MNGVFVGEHEGGEDVFVLDVTEAIKPTAINRIAVRVLNPTEEPIDGIVRGEIPQMGLESGILDSVELLIAPAARIENLFVVPDPKTGDIHIQVITYPHPLDSKEGDLSNTIRLILVRFQRLKLLEIHLVWCSIVERLM